MTARELQAKLKSYLAADPDFRAVYDYTRSRFEEAKNLSAHNWEHAYRDLINAIIIGEAEKADMTVVLPATVMHDIGFLYGGTGGTHGEIGADKLEQYLQEGNIKLDPAKVAHISDCIRTHKGSMHGEKPATLEAKVVSDADMLEKFGPVGTYQTIRTFTEFGWDAPTIMKRFQGIADLTFQTETGKKMGEPMRAFVGQFAAELSKAYEIYQEDK